MKVQVLLIALVLVAGCAAQEHRAIQTGIKVWSSSELNARKGELDGTEVVLDAYLIHEPENYALWDNEQASRSGDPHSCISLIYPKHIGQSVRRSNRKQVRLRGTFVRDVTAQGGVYLGLCNYTGLRVVEIVR